MDFNKKIDYDDINNFLPDNKTLATSEYFQNKFVGLPSYMCDMLEVKSRVEYNEKSEIEFINFIKENKKKQDESPPDSNNGDNTDELCKKSRLDWLRFLKGFFSCFM